MTVRAARFAVIDDNESHVRIIKGALDRLGKPCLGMVYTVEEGPRAGWLRGVRVLFLDLHLSAGGLGTTDERHFSVISDLLIQSASPVGGPFIIVLWTESPEQESELKRHISERIPAEHFYARPVDVVALPKRSFLNAAGNDVNDTSELETAIARKIMSSPQLAAIMAWEDDVHAAAAETLSGLLASIPDEHRIPERYGQALDKVMTRLASSVVGAANVSQDPRAAMSAALAPILADRIQNQEADGPTAGVWRAAITQNVTERPSAEEAARVNRMLHIASTNAETITGNDWGAVVDLPVYSADKKFLDLFGIESVAALRDQYFISESSAYAACTWRLIHLGAACDHAQPKDMPASFVLALEVPSEVKRQRGGLRPQEWVSPTFQKDGAAGQFTLVANARYVVSVTRSKAASFQARYRLREQLLSHLIKHVADYGSRPGVVALYP